MKVWAPCENLILTLGWTKITPNSFENTIYKHTGFWRTLPLKIQNHSLVLAGYDSLINNQFVLENDIYLCGGYGLNTVKLFWTIENASNGKTFRAPKKFQPISRPRHVMKVNPPLQYFTNYWNVSEIDGLSMHTMQKTCFLYLI